MDISPFQFSLLVMGALGMVYGAAWLASRAFFNNKADYHKKLMQQLEERADAEKER